jgi:hypothetical protein
MAKIELRDSILTKAWSNLMLEIWDCPRDQYFMRYTYGENMSCIIQDLTGTLGVDGQEFCQVLYIVWML